MPITIGSISVALKRSLAMRAEIQRAGAKDSEKHERSTATEKAWLTEKARLAAAASDKQAQKLAALRTLDEQKERDRQAHAADCVRRFIEINS